MPRVNREYYVGLAKDRFGVPRDQSDGLLSDALIYQALDDAMDMVADDLSLDKTLIELQRIAGQWRYELPPQVLSIRNMWFLDHNNKWRRIKYEEAEDFLSHFDEDFSSSYRPRAWSVFGRASETFNWDTESDIATNKFVTSFQVSESSNSEVICYGANFGLLDSDHESHIKKSDVVWNVIDNSYGFVDYLDCTEYKESDVSIIKTNHEQGIMTADGSLADSGISRGDIVIQQQNDRFGNVAKTYAYVVGIEVQNLYFNDIQGDAFGRDFEDYTVKIGTADKVVLQQYGSSEGGLRAGLRNTFQFQAIETNKTFSDTLETKYNANDTIVFDSAIDPMVGTGMTIRATDNTATGQRRVAEIQEISDGNTKATVRYWVGGAPTEGYAVDFGVGDLFEIQSRFRTKDTFWLRPTPTVTDLDVARLKMLYIPLPQKPDSSDDPIEIDFRYSSPLSACLYWLCAERQGSYSQRELQGFKGDYMERKDDVRPVSSTPTGQHLSVLPGGTTGGSGSEYDVDTWDSSGIYRLE